MVNLHWIEFKAQLYSSWDPFGFGSLKILPYLRFWEKKNKNMNRKMLSWHFVFLETLYIAVHGSKNELSCGGRPSGVNYILPFQWADIGVTN